MKAKKLNDTVLEELYEGMNGLAAKVEAAWLLAWDDVRRDVISANNITHINEKRIDQFNQVHPTLHRLPAHLAA